MIPEEKSVDAVISVYGKPYQTAVTLLSLMKYSGHWIDKIYFIEERRQPGKPDFRPLLDFLGDRVVYYKPSVFLWVNELPLRGLLLKMKWVRNAIRYQYAWEHSDKKHLLILHNDLLFTGDLVAQYLTQLGEHTGIGRIGQCWNCPAYKGLLCDPDRYMRYRPDYRELMEITERFEGTRRGKYHQVINHTRPWPLPECRLNEYVAMINLEKARPATAPFGPAPPFGSYNALDLGIDWFHALSNQGHTFHNFDFDPFAIHSWISLKNAGHDALFDRDLYENEEKVARGYLEKEYGLIL